jgi:hypothetical protein
MPKNNKKTKDSHKEILNSTLKIQQPGNTCQLAKKTNMQSKNRSFSLTLIAKKGIVDMYAWINEELKIPSRNNGNNSWQGEIPTTPVELKIRVIGIEGGSFTINKNGEITTKTLAGSEYREVSKI